VSPRDDVLVWIDLEMTGLDPETCAIVEMAMILTDRELNRLADPFAVAIWQPESVLQSMGPFVRTMHEKTGLLDKIRASKVTVNDVESRALEILARYATYRTARLCGNSVWQDRRFLCKYMPLFDQYMHYRLVDVSTLKELAGWWYNTSYDKPSDGEHAALFDIEQSIAELQFLRGAVFK